MPPAREPKVGERPDPGSIRLRLSPPARQALSAALVDRPGGSGIRIWVERGMRPHPQMMVDRASPRDIPVTVDGVPLLVDEASVPFLRDAEVFYHADVNPPGFEVVGPFLPSPAPTASAPEPERARTSPGGPPREADEKIRRALKNVYDPEIPMNIVDLGLLYGFDWKPDGSLTIRMTMTSPGCPAVEELVHEVETIARASSGASSVKVEVVWEPPWSPERMSDFARRQFGYA